MRLLQLIPYYMSANYAQKVLATNPLAYWKLNEGSGTTIIDSSGNGYNGTSTGWTWDGTKFSKGGVVPFSDGTSDYGNVYSASLASAFNMDEGSALIWFKVASASVWTDAANRDLLRLFRDATNLITITKTSTNNTLRFRRTGGGVTDDVTWTTSSIGWNSILISWSVSGDAAIAYFNGVQQGATQTGLVAAVGSGLNSAQTVIGASTTTALNVFHGYPAQVAAWTTPATTATIALGI